MSGQMKVRNSCPFKVIFYALGGPTIELKPGETRSAEACLIWFSTRVKGPGVTINEGFLESMMDDYKELMAEYNSQAGDYHDGSTGAYLGSVLGYTMGQLEMVFKVHTTEDGNGDVYVGALKEGVYGTSELAIWATLDPSSSAPKFPKMWILHVDYENNQQTLQTNQENQQTGPVYEPPNLAEYENTLFFRLRNKVQRSGYLYVRDDNRVLVHRDTSGTAPYPSFPYDPLKRSEYWSVNPIASNGSDVKILNHSKNSWLTGYGDHVGMYPLGYADYPDQHWRIVARDGSAMLHNKGRSDQCLFSSDAHGVGHVGYFYPSYPDQRWIVETFADDLAEFPADRPFRIMHCQTGQYLTIPQSGSGDCRLAPLDENNRNSQLFTLEKHTHEFKLKATSGLYLLFASGNMVYNPGSGQLGVFSGSSPSTQLWKLERPNDRCGFFLVNKSLPSNYHLYYNGKHFGMQGGDNPDQRWIVMMDYLPNFG